MSNLPNQLIRKRRIQQTRKENRQLNDMNEAFTRLQSCIPFIPNGQRLPKIKTLRLALLYIDHLDKMLNSNIEVWSPELQQKRPLQLKDFTPIAMAELQSRNNYKDRAEKELLRGVRTEDICRQTTSRYQPRQQPRSRMPGAVSYASPGYHASSAIPLETSNVSSELPPTHACVSATITPTCLYPPQTTFPSHSCVSGTLMRPENVQSISSYLPTYEETSPLFYPASSQTSRAEFPATSHVTQTMMPPQCSNNPGNRPVTSSYLPSDSYAAVTQPTTTTQAMYSSYSDASETLNSAQNSAVPSRPQYFSTINPSYEEMSPSALLKKPSSVFPTTSHVKQPAQYSSSVQNKWASFQMSSKKPTAISSLTEEEQLAYSCFNWSHKLFDQPSQYIVDGPDRKSY